MIRATSAVAIAGAWIAASASACARPSPAAPGPGAPGSGPAAVDYDTEEVLRLAGVDAGAPFYDAASYDPSITPPADCVGHPLGARPAAPDRIVACFRRWAEQSPRVQVARYALSHEGRELIRAVITTPDNLSRLDRIKADLAKLANPRGLPAGEAERIVARTPAVGWFAYSIHGNEMSGADASLAFAYHLIAGGDAVAPLLEDVVVVVDPSMNPDGRQRTLNAIEEMGSHVPGDNYAGMERWRWPGGRGNHYLFDLNRDWLWGVHPETRGRWAEILAFHPQLFVDAHEMGSLDTYLFSPKNKPYNPGFPAAQLKWYRVFADDIAAAFDRHGWPYYTREWSDGWFPGYSSTWGPIHGAIGFLYEQASTRGLDVLRPSGARVTYRDTLRGHAVASLVNLATLARTREAVLRDYLAARRDAIGRPGRGARAFVMVPGRSPDRERALLEILMRQGVEVHEATAAFTARDVHTATGGRRAVAQIPAGAYVIFEAQAQGNLVTAALAFDPRQDADSLLRERRALERNGESTIYDVTAWNLGQAFAVDAYWTAAPAAGLRPVREVPALPVGVPHGVGEQSRAAPADGAAYAWVVDGGDDGSPVFAAHAMELGLTVHIADEAFEVEGRGYARGSLLVRASENPADTPARVAEAAAAARVLVYATRTGRAPGDGADLGGRHFLPLSRPRVALLANSPIASNSFGHVWHHLDRRLRIPITIVDVQALSQHDLRRYNAIVLPDARRESATIRGVLGAHKQALAAWVAQGGTLIAMGGSAAALASKDLGLAQVRLRRDVLDALPVYEAAARRSVASRQVTIDERALWSGAPAAGRPAPSRRGGPPASSGALEPPGEASAGGDKARPGADAAKALAEQRDAWERRFSPRGAMLLGLVDQAAWITAGLPDQMPVLFGGDAVFLATDPVRVAVRLAAADALRLSGLVWPEARGRLAHSSYLAVERSGRGQVVLFAFEPVYRGFTRGTARLLSNAVVYGPGLGADQPHPWAGQAR